MRHLYHGAWVTLVAKINETSTRAVALLSDRVARGEGALVDLVIVLRPARPVLHALAPGSQEIAIHAGGIAALLDELELDIAGVRQRYGDVDVVVAPAGVGEASDGQTVGVEPRSDAANLHPVPQRWL